MESTYITSNQMNVQIIMHKLQVAKCLYFCQALINILSNQYTKPWFATGDASDRTF